MKISVDYKGAEEMIKLINDTIQGEKLSLGNLRLILEQTQGYKMFFKFYKKQNFKEEYINMLKNISEHLEYTTNNPILQRMSMAYKMAYKKPELLYQKLKEVESIDFYSLENRLQECLPANTELTMDIYFILDGNNGGSIVDEHTFCLDVLFWTVKEELCKQMEGIILHELHHIGAMYWEKKDTNRENIISQKDGKGLAVDLLDSVLGEGSAFYFFNDDLNMYELVREEYGDEFAQDFQNSYCESWSDLDIKIKELDEFLVKLLKSQDKEYNELRIEASNYNHTNNNKEALDKIIGSYMCSIIEEAFGKEGILNCIKELQKFSVVYNDACSKLNKKGRFSKELIDLLNNAWVCK